MGNNLPRVDISILLFKTRPYLNELIPSLFKINYPKDKLMIYVINNESPDDSFQEFQKRCKGLKYFRFINSGVNLGFAEGHNVTMRVGEGKYTFLLNPDGKIFPDTIKLMVKKMEKNPRVGLADGIQFPTIHHKGFDPKSYETSWCSGACMMIRKAALKNTGLFDGKFFMYAEDVDLSWRMWSKGWKCITIPEARVIHYLVGHKKQKHKVGQIRINENYRSLRNGLFLRFIYGNSSNYFRFALIVAKLLSVKDYMILLIKFLMTILLFPFPRLQGSRIDRLKITGPGRRSMTFRALWEQLTFLPHLRVRRKLQKLNQRNAFVAQWEKL